MCCEEEDKEEDGEALVELQCASLAYMSCAYINVTSHMSVHGVKFKRTKAKGTKFEGKSFESNGEKMRVLRFMISSLAYN